MLITQDVSPSSRILFIAQGPLSALDTVERFEQHWAAEKGSDHATQATVRLSDVNSRSDSAALRCK